MATNYQENQDTREVDLSMISKKISSSIDGLNNFIFRAIQFVLKHIVILGVLFVLGAGIGIYLDKVSKSYDNQIIVRPNFGSTDYLYSRIELIDSKIKDNDTVFLKKLGIADPSKLVKISIKPIIDVYQFVNSNSEQNFQMLKLMAEDSDIKKIVEDNTTSKNYKYHLISFTTKKKTSYEKTIAPLLNFFNNNEFFRKIQKENVNNVHIKIKANDVIISQIDNFLNTFGDSNMKSDKLVYYNETQLNDVIETKDKLINEQGYLRIELVSLDKIVKQVNIVLNSENKEAVNGKIKLILPIIFILIYLAIYSFSRFYKKQSLKLTNNS